MARHRPEHAIELYRDENAYVVYVELPGYDESEIDVRWHDRRLTISAEHASVDGRNTVFHRNMGLPRQIWADEIEAIYEDEVLEVTLPIADRNARPGREIKLE
jgi:HSP20 family protein